MLLLSLLLLLIMIFLCPALEFFSRNILVKKRLGAMIPGMWSQSKNPLSLLSWVTGMLLPLDMTSRQDRQSHFCAQKSVFSRPAGWLGSIRTCCSCSFLAGSK